jgi:hypothetical protein
MKSATISCFLAVALCVAAAEASAQDTPLLDYRQSAPVGTTSTTAAEIDEVLDLLSTAEPEYRRMLGDDPLFMGRADGSFTEAGAEQGAWLFSKRPSDPVYPEFNPDMPLLVVVDRQGGLVMVSKPHQAHAHERVLAAADPDDDGVDIVLLEQSSLERGVLEVWVDPVSLRDGRPVMEGGWRAVYDRCEQGIHPRSRIVSAFFIRNGIVDVETTTLPCPPF